MIKAPVDGLDLGNSGAMGSILRTGTLAERRDQ